MKLDLGCGRTPFPEFEGVDLYTEEATHKVDLFQFPWPFDADSVEEIRASHFFEHVPGKMRGQFMEEVWRILKPGARATFITPFWSSTRAVQDPTHEWPPICEATYLYFNKDWRRANNLDHAPYPTRCDFDFGYGYSPNPRMTGRTQEFFNSAVASQLNAVDDLTVTLVKKA